MEYKGFTLDPFQVRAIRALDNRHSVVVSAPTGSGKTLTAEYVIDEHLRKGEQVVYTAPIKALSNEKYKDFCELYGEDRVGLLTGDVIRNPTAPIRIMTTEIYRNMCLTQDPTMESVAYVVFDEIHYIDDVERGYVWEEAIIFSKDHVRFLCLSATIPNADELAEWIEHIKNHKVECITHDVRSVPLHHMLFDVEHGLSSLDTLYKALGGVAFRRRARRRRGERIPLAPDHRDVVKELKSRTPLLYFCFSRRLCERYARELSRKRLFEANAAVSRRIRERLQDFPDVARLESTKLLRECLPRGIGFHHAGLLPVMKELVEEFFGAGHINILYTTETFAVGLNMPAKTVCFNSLRKFDGITFRWLNGKEYFQIAGRAGRRGKDKEGFVVSVLDRRDFDYQRIKKLFSGKTEPIESKFKLSYNTALNLVKRHEEQEIDLILKQSLFAFQERKSLRPRFDRLVRKLKRLEYIKDDVLTVKGEFASNMFSDELVFAEIFATDFIKDLSAYQVLLVLGCMAYEYRKGNEIKKSFRDKESRSLKKKVRDHKYLAYSGRFEYLDDVTGLVKPCFEQRDFFVMVENTTMLEGDVLRFLTQMLDRMRHILKATHRMDVRDRIGECEFVVKSTVEDVFVL